MPAVLIVSLNADPTAKLADPFAGGQAKTIRALAFEFVSKNWTVDVCTLSTGHYPEVEQIAPGFKIFRFPSKESLGFTYSYNCKDIEGLFHVASEKLASVPISLVIGCYWAGGYLAQLLANQIGVPLAIMMCSYGAERALVVDEDLRERLSVEATLLRTADGVIVTTRHEETLIHKNYGVTPCQILRCPRGVDLELFAPRLQLLFVGRPVARKGLEVLFSAMELDLQKNWRLTVAGPDGTDTWELAKKHKIERNRLQCLGPVSQVDMPDVMARCDIVVVPSLYETFGNVVLEAMACGRPVVASAVGGLMELVDPEQTGLLVPPGDAQALHAALTILETQPEWRAAMGTKARLRSHRYDARSIYGEMSAFLMGLRINNR